MTTKKILLMMLAAVMAVSGCKTDDEDDIKVTPTEDQSYAGLYLNEVCGKQDPDDDWVELYNASAKDISLDGCTLVKTDENGKTKVIYTAPTGTVIKAGEYKVIATLSGELQAGISNTKISFQHGFHVHYYNGFPIWLSHPLSEFA